MNRGEESDKPENFEPEPAGLARLPRWVPDALGVAWVLAAAVAVMVPALVHGTSLGPFNILSQFGLSQQAQVKIPNPYIADQVDEMIPWSTLAWQQVHSGHLPLWNPYSGLGTPLAFNWVSSAFSVPTLVSYVFPLRLAYTAQTIMTLFIAGTGGYVLGRVLRLGVIASAFLGTVFELSGPIMTWLGWPQAAVAAWLGWLIVATILVLRGHKRLYCTVFLSVVIACTIYAGHPEILLLVALSVGIFVIVYVVVSWWQQEDSRSTTWRSVLDLVIAVVLGLALGAPLLLPGLQLIRGSARTTFMDAGFTSGTVVDLVVPAFERLAPNAAYLGVVVCMLAIVGIRFRWRRPEVLGLVAVAIVTGALSFLPEVTTILNRLPDHLPAEAWSRARMPMALVVAALAAIGLDVLVRCRELKVLQWAAGALVAVAAFVGLARLAGSGLSSSVAQGSLAQKRSQSFEWALIGIVVAAAVIGALMLAERFSLNGRFRRGTGVAILLAQTCLLIGIGAPYWSTDSNSEQLHPTPAEATLQRSVGSSLVGLGSGSCVKKPGLGFFPEVNVAFGVREFAVYDPAFPASYFSDWARLVKTPVGLPNGPLIATPFGRVRVVTPVGLPPVYLFCPVIDGASVARIFGIRYVLEHAGTPGPSGTAFVRRIGDEDLYRVTGVVAPATLTALTGSGKDPPANAPSKPIPVAHPNPATWRMTTNSPSAGELRLRLTNVPGWKATLDGHPLSLHPFYGTTMLQASIPAGRHTIEVSYWPTTFTVGLFLAGVGVVGIVLVIALDVVRKSRRRTRTAPSLT